MAFPLNGGLENLLDGDKVRVFNNQPEAEAFLLANGFIRRPGIFIFGGGRMMDLQVDRREG